MSHIIYSVDYGQKVVRDLPVVDVEVKNLKILVPSCAVIFVHPKKDKHYFMNLTGRNKALVQIAERLSTAIKNQRIYTDEEIDRDPILASSVHQPVQFGVNIMVNGEESDTGWIIKGNSLEMRVSFNNDDNHRLCGSKEDLLALFTKITLKVLHTEGLDRKEIADGGHSEEGYSTALDGI